MCVCVNIICYSSIALLYETWLISALDWFEIIRLVTFLSRNQSTPKQPRPQTYYHLSSFLLNIEWFEYSFNFMYHFWYIHINIYAYYLLPPFPAPPSSPHSLRCIIIPIIQLDRVQLMDVCASERPSFFVTIIVYRYHIVLELYCKYIDMELLHNYSLTSTHFDTIRQIFIFHYFFFLLTGRILCFGILPKNRSADSIRAKPCCCLLKSTSTATFSHIINNTP